MPSAASQAPCTSRIASLGPNPELHLIVRLQGGTLRGVVGRCWMATFGTVQASQAPPRLESPAPTACTTHGAVPPWPRTTQVPICTLAIICTIANQCSHMISIVCRSTLWPPKAWSYKGVDLLLSIECAHCRIPGHVFAGEERWCSSTASQLPPSARAMQQGPSTRCSRAPVHHHAPEPPRESVVLTIASSTNINSVHRWPQSFCASATDRHAQKKHIQHLALTLCYRCRTSGASPALQSASACRWPKP